MKLSDVFKIISVELYNRDNKYVDLKCKMFQANYCVHSTSPLSISGRHYILKDNEFVFEDREIPLKDSSILVYDETGHSGEWNITEYDSLDEVEKFVLSGAGYFNMFCTHIVVFTPKIVLCFNPYYVDENGIYNFLSKEDEDYCKYNLKLKWDAK